jgi:hypothetical protein
MCIGLYDMAQPASAAYISIVQHSLLPKAPFLQGFKADARLHTPREQLLLPFLQWAGAGAQWCCMVGVVYDMQPVQVCIHMLSTANAELAVSSSRLHVLSHAQELRTSARTVTMQ